MAVGVRAAASLLKINKAVLQRAVAPRRRTSWRDRRRGRPDVPSARHGRGPGRATAACAATASAACARCMVLAVHTFVIAMGRNALRRHSSVTRGWFMHTFGTHSYAMILDVRLQLDWIRADNLVQQLAAFEELESGHCRDLCSGGDARLVVHVHLEK